eukprot:803816-Karenia_brevis.AAC.1
MARDMIYHGNEWELLDSEHTFQREAADPETVGLQMENGSRRRAAKCLGYTSRHQMERKTSRVFMTNKQTSDCSPGGKTATCLSMCYMLINMKQSPTAKS